MTVYRIARDEEYSRLYEIFDIETPLTWPVIIAEREGDIIGMLGTHGDDRLCAGPLQVKMPQGRTHVFVASRLARVYDDYMRSIGMKKFDFYVEKGINDHYIKQIERLPIYNKTFENDEFIWYERVF